MALTITVFVSALCAAAVVVRDGSSVYVPPPPVVSHGYAPALYVEYKQQPHYTDAEYDADPSYAYAYGVHDQLTGDSKSQRESRHGDVVHGSYSLIDPDGTKRTVDYTADPHNGFNAVVTKEPIGAVINAYHRPVNAYAAPVYPTIDYHHHPYPTYR